MWRSWVPASGESMRPAGRYYNRPARRLTQSQAAALAATLPFPLGSNPKYKPARMRRRQDLILRRMQGERVVVPKIEDEPVLQPGDTIQWTAGLDSLLDSLRAPVETLESRGQRRGVAWYGPARRLGAQRLSP